MAKRRRREYLILLENAKAAAETAIDSYNRVKHPYRNETTLILLTNAWELLAKAILVHVHQPITQGQRGDTISAERSIGRLLHRNDIGEHVAETVQQVISLRNAATHHYLPAVPDEVMQHLLFFSCKFFREAVEKHFRNHAKDLEQNYLSLSFAELTTYADKVQKIVSRVKKSDSDKRLAWLLERGITFDGAEYITQAQFEAKYRSKRKIMPHLGISKFLKQAEMVKIVAVQAPKNYTADLALRKGNSRDASLPVSVRKTDVDADYPYLTKELAEALGTSTQFAAKAAQVLNLKGDPTYHTAIRSSKSGNVQRYSEAARQVLRQKLTEDPGYSPFS